MRRVDCQTCGVKDEKHAFLSANTKYTLRFAMQIGGLRRDDNRRLRAARCIWIGARSKTSTKSTCASKRNARAAPRQGSAAQD
jgi:hypothetical protein